MAATFKFFNTYLAPATDLQLDLGSGSLRFNRLYIAQLVAGGAEGTKIGTADTDTVGFYGTTPVDQAGNTEDLKDVLTNLGLLKSGGATPLNLDGGTLTAGDLVVDTLTLIVQTNFAFLNDEIVSHDDDAVFIL